MLGLVTVSLATLPLVAGACAAGDEIGETVGSVTQQIDEGIQAVPVANQEVCAIERTTLLTAVEAYTALEGAPPAAEADLVGLVLREEVASYDLDPTGAVVPAVGSNCT